MGINQIAKATPYSSTAVGSYVKKLGISRKFHRRGKESEELDKAIKKLYLEGLYEREIAEKLNIRCSTVNYRVGRMGIARHRGPKSKVGNENYFDNINSQRKAYWLGWIMADGNVSIYNGQYSLKLNIMKQDKMLIENFLNDIKGDYKIHDRMVSTPQGKLKEASYVSITSRHMVEKLIEYGVIPRKTGFEKFPENLPDIYKRHFLRGFFDAEGHVSYRREFRNNYYSIGFTTNYTMCQAIEEYIGIGGKLHKCEGAYQLVYGKKNGKVLFEILYKDADFYLPRKHDKFVKLLNS